MCERLYQGAAAAVSIDPIASLTLVLAALAALLAVMTIIIGIAAVWGYFGIRDSVKDMAIKKVDDAMKEALEKYPNAADMLKTMQRLRDQADFLDQVRNQVVTAPEPKIVETASKQGVQRDIAETPLESVEQQVTPIAKYPGEESKDDASDDGQSS
jgi:hypothetical protein